jgi:hypothetical protein
MISTINTIIIKHTLITTYVRNSLKSPSVKFNDVSDFIHNANIIKYYETTKFMVKKKGQLSVPFKFKLMWFPSFSLF